MFEASEIKSPTGASLGVYSSTIKAPKAVLHINHGMSEHGKRYQRFAEFLASRGYASLAHDHRGHGATTAADAPQGIFSNQDGLAKVLADADAVNDHIRQQNPNVPIVLFGHSMGSILGLNYCIHHHEKIAGAALWNSGVDGGPLLTIYGFLLTVERFFKGSDVPSQIANKLAFDAWNKKFAPNRTQSDWLSRDEAEVDKYIADPDCGFDASNGLWRDLLGGIRRGADNAELAKIRNDLPIHLLAGTKDPCTNNGTAVERLHDRMSKNGIQDLSLTLLPDTRHESLNEINRDQTMADFVQWLDERFA
ncbi:MAG: alpha/beta hydrolase [Pseudomonadota bacterium]